MLHRITLQSAISTLVIAAWKRVTETVVGEGRVLSTANTRLFGGWAIVPSAIRSTLEMVGVMVVQTTQRTIPPRASLMVVTAARTAAVDPFVGRTGLTTARRMKPWQTR